jgi:hypothetical protein
MNRVALAHKRFPHNMIENVGEGYVYVQHVLRTDLGVEVAKYGVEVAKYGVEVVRYGVEVAKYGVEVASHGFGTKRTTSTDLPKGLPLISHFVLNLRVPYLFELTHHHTNIE